MSDLETTSLLIRAAVALEEIDPDSDIINDINNHLGRETRAVRRDGIDQPTTLPRTTEAPTQEGWQPIETAPGEKRLLLGDRV